MSGAFRSPAAIEFRAQFSGVCPIWRAIAALSLINHSSHTQFSRQNVSAIVLNVSCRPVAGPNTPPRCVAVDKMR